MVYVVPLLAFIIPLIAGVVALRRRQGRAVPVIAGLGAVIMIWAIWQGRQHQGWNAIGYAIVAVLIAAPAILGVLTGAAIGWWRRRAGAGRAGR